MKEGFATYCRRGSLIPAALFAVLLWLLASLPGSDLQRLQNVPQSPLLAFILSDPAMHFLTSGLLALLVSLGFYRGPKGAIPFAKVAALTWGYGLLIEVYQGILPWRSFGLEDLTWNTLGVVLAVGSLAWRAWSGRKPHRT